MKPVDERPEFSPMHSSGDLEGVRENTAKVIQREGWSIQEKERIIVRGSVHPAVAEKRKRSKR